MFKVTATTTRPSKDVAYYTPDAEYTAWFKASYQDTNLCVRTKSTSGNGLTVMSDAYWDSEASYNDYQSQDKAKAMFADRDAYNTLNGITRAVIRNGVPVVGKKK